MIFSLMNCDLELFTFADNCFRDFKHIKHCFLVNSAFLLPFCVWLWLLDICLEIFQLISSQKVCHYLGGDKGGRWFKANGDKWWQGYGDILFECPLICAYIWAADRRDKEVCQVFRRNNLVCQKQSSIDPNIFSKFHHICSVFPRS